MPDNTWFTPYKLPSSTCLSLGPSQGIAYKLSDEVVVKLPFQYPVARSPPVDDTIEQMYMSLESLAMFEKESKFYDVLANNQHPNIAQRLQTQLSIGIVLPYYKPLVSAVIKLEDLRYTHGDLKVRNMGIDRHNQLRLFDFGSVRHSDDEDYAAQFKEDQYALATSIHFLASGVDVLANANSRVEVLETLNMLKGGRGIVDEAAKDFDHIIQTGWTGTVSSFTSLSKSIDISNNMAEKKRELSHEVQPDLDYLAIELDHRWLDEEAYRAAWDEGYETPDNIWG